MLKSGLKGAAYAAAFTGIQLWQGRDAVRGVAPTLTARPLVAGTEAFTGGPGIVHFWATWCGVCHAMASNIEGFDAGPVWRVVTQSGSRSEVLENVGADREGLLYDDGRDARAWGVSAFPTTFFVRADGQIGDVTVGYSTALGLRLRWAFSV